MMSNVKSDNTGMDIVKFILARIKRIYPCFLLSSVIYYLMYYGINIERQEFAISTEINNLIYGGLFLSETGLGIAIGPTWYISAMLIGMLLLYPILSKTANSKMFSCVYAPIFSCFIYFFKSSVRVSSGEYICYDRRCCLYDITQSHERAGWFNARLFYL